MSKEVLIALMGTTGVGKSSFIKCASGNPDIQISDSLSSTTSEVQSYRFTHDNIAYTLIDTPGFDDTHISDDVVTSKILEWLATSYRSGAKLHGIVYLHRISDIRMQGSALKNNRMFRKLVGIECFPNIVLGTTFWKNVTEEEGSSRENELRENQAFWKGMVERGSEMRRIGLGRDECLDVLRYIAAKQEMVLAAQHEIVDEHKTFEDTEAAKILKREADELARELDEKHQREVEELAAQNAREIVRRDEQHKQERFRLEEEERQREQREREATRIEMENAHQVALQQAEEQRQREESARHVEAEQRASRERELEAERIHLQKEKERIIQKKKKEERKRRQQEEERRQHDPCIIL